ncbi:ATP-dependent DNA ligase [Agromyces badenianii]|uniref:DUF7882 family protein n=1 Tax=Agromyces badenianii TaxID=2080742 RepID=UPI000D5A2006|nr:ATP-dependent DNA ligase [Agromyces badenianii]PWC05933.1 ATP-dependent DNA ligase [Agromyces badenianii]
MGKFVYDDSRQAEFEDRALLHLQTTILNKLRRQESFVFTWWDSRGGFVSVWLHPSVALQFVYAGNRMPTENRAWLEALSDAANSTSGLVLVPEPPLRDGPAPLD